MHLATMLPKITGTESFRLSGAALWNNYPYEMGRNLQNITKNTRKYFIAPEGFSIVQCDQAGAEALIVAYECVPAKMRALFDAGIKPHTFVAGWNFAEQFIAKGVDRNHINSILACRTSADIKALPALPHWKVLDKTIRSSDDWPSDQRYYFMGKTLCHSGNYGASEKIYQRTLLIRSGGLIRVSLAEARRARECYNKQLFPELGVWHQEVEERLKRDRMLTNLFGYPRHLTGAIGKLTEWIAWVPQSTVGCITHLAAIAMEHFIEDNNLDWRLINNCHDSLAYLAPDSEAQACATQLKIAMQQKLTSSRGEVYSMKAETAIGKNWGPKKADNPEGLC